MAEEKIKIASHACESSYQDGKYGKGKRVFNAANPAKKVGKPYWICTVCGKGD